MSNQSDSPHAVIVCFRWASEDLAPLYALDQRLATAIEDAGAGTYEGHEVALLEGDDAYLFMEGPDADQLFAVARPILEATPMLDGARATLRYGSPDDETARAQDMIIAGAQTCVIPAQ